MGRSLSSSAISSSELDKTGSSGLPARGMDLAFLAAEAFGGGLSGDAGRRWARRGGTSGSGGRSPLAALEGLALAAAAPDDALGISSTFMNFLSRHSQALWLPPHTLPDLRITAQRCIPVQSSFSFWQRPIW